MALARTFRVAEDFTDAGGSSPVSQTTASFTPSDNSLLVVAFAGIAYLGGVETGDISADSWSVSGGGLTWTQRKRVTALDGADYVIWLEVWTAPVTTGASMTVTISHPATISTPEYLALAASVSDVTGYDTGSPVGASASGTQLGGDAGSITLDAAPASDSIVLAALNAQPNEGASAATPGTGWSEVSDTPITGTFSWGHLQTQDRGGSTSTTVAWADTIDSGTEWHTLAAAIEIKAAGGGGNQELTPALFTDGDVFFTPTVSRGAVSLTPSLFSDGDTFHAAVLLATYSLQPSLYSDGDTFHQPTVAPGAVTLAPSLFVDDDTFYEPTLSADGIEPPEPVKRRGATWVSLRKKRKKELERERQEAEQLAREVEAAYLDATGTRPKPVEIVAAKAVAIVTDPDEAEIDELLELLSIVDMH